MRHDDVLLMPEPVYYGGTIDRSVGSEDIAKGVRAERAAGRGPGRRAPTAATARGTGPARRPHRGHGRARRHPVDLRGGAAGPPVNAPRAEKCSNCPCKTFISSKAAVKRPSPNCALAKRGRGDEHGQDRGLRRHGAAHGAGRLGGRGLRPLSGRAGHPGHRRGRRRRPAGRPDRTQRLHPEDGRRVRPRPVCAPSRLGPDGPLAAAGRGRRLGRQPVPDHGRGGPGRHAEGVHRRVARALCRRRRGAARDAGGGGHPQGPRRGDERSGPEPGPRRSRGPRLQPRQVRIPGGDEPRDPHAAERGAGRRRPDGARTDAGVAAPLCPHHSRLRAAACCGC